MNSIVVVKRLNDYLEHHGIQGQKWGVRNGPPYPLDKSRYSSAEKTAGGALTTALVYTATLAAYYGLAVLATNLADKRRTKQFEEEYYEKRKTKNFSDIDRIDPNSMSMEDHMKEINPDYPAPGTTQNCMFCTTAMAMRMHGYDVSAVKCPDGWSAKNISSTWEGFKEEEPACSNANEMKKYLASQGDGAYGNLMVYWNLGGGHSVFYKVDKDDVSIYDTQSNEKYSLNDLEKKVIMPRSQVIRLDDKEPTEKVLGAVTKREDKKQ